MCKYSNNQFSFLDHHLTFVCLYIQITSHVTIEPITLFFCLTDYAIDHVLLLLLLSSSEYILCHTRSTIHVVSDQLIYKQSTTCLCMSLKLSFFSCAPHEIYRQNSSE
jgi:hypothetical protein